MPKKKNNTEVSGGKAGILAGWNNEIQKVITSSHNTYQFYGNTITRSGEELIKHDLIRWRLYFYFLKDQDPKTWERIFEESIDFSELFKKLNVRHTFAKNKEFEKYFFNMLMTALNNFNENDCEAYLEWRIGYAVEKLNRSYKEAVAAILKMVKVIDVQRKQPLDQVKLAAIQKWAENEDSLRSTTVTSFLQDERNYFLASLIFGMLTPMAYLFSPFYITTLAFTGTISMCITGIAVMKSKDVKNVKKTIDDIDGYVSENLKINLITEIEDGEERLTMQIEWQPPLDLTPKKAPSTYRYFQEEFKDTPSQFQKNDNDKSKEEDEDKNTDKKADDKNSALVSELINQGERLLFIDSYSGRKIEYYGKLALEKEKIDEYTLESITKAFNKGFVEKGKEREGIQGIVRANHQYDGANFKIQISKKIRVKPIEITRSDEIISLHFNTFDKNSHDQNRKVIPKIKEETGNTKIPKRR